MKKREEILNNVLETMPNAPDATREAYGKMEDWLFQYVNLIEERAVLWACRCGYEDALVAKETTCHD